MKVRIYQINPERDTSRMAFHGSRDLEKDVEAGVFIVKHDIYDCVFEGNINLCGDDIDSDLEKIFEIFNLCPPLEHKGRSMSVSDVVEIFDADGQSKLYLCDIFGFVEVRFYK